MTSMLRSKWAVVLGSTAAAALMPATAMATVSVTTTTDATTLANSILGTGITIVGTPTYIGAANQSGTFTGGNSAGLGIDEGLILTSGDATLAPGPNTADDAAANLGTPGDADLDAQIAPDTTNDAASLEFEFQFGDGSVGGDVFFDFIFASEEYNEFIGSFNDPFALLIDGVNVAIAPDGQTVSVDTVNCGDPFSPPTGPNCASFNNNDLDDGGPFFDIEYDGFTDVFMAEALGLGPGTHSAKFVIADANDSVLDSAVFIAGESFADEPSDMPEPATLALVGAGLAGVGFAARRCRKAA